MQQPAAWLLKGAAMTTIVKRVIDGEQRWVPLITRPTHPKPLAHPSKPMLLKPGLAYFMGEFRVWDKDDERWS